MSSTADCRKCSGYWKGKKRCVIYSKEVTDTTQAKTCKGFYEAKR